MATATFYPSKDTWINAHLKDTNYGAANTIFLGALYFGGDKTLLGRGLLGFDLSGLVGAGVVVAAALTWDYNDVVGVPFSATFYRLNPAGPWTEGGATYKMYDGTNLWAAEGGDWDPVTPPPLGVSLAGASGSAETLAGFKDFVQDALDNRGGQLEIICKLDDEIPGVSKVVSPWQRQYGATGPRLVVDYEQAGRRREGGDVGTGRERQPRRPPAPSGPRQARRPRSWWASP